jgi:N-acetylmuramoyl-L-alanine amidase
VAWRRRKPDCRAALVLAVLALPVAYAHADPGRSARITAIREQKDVQGERIVFELEREVEVRQGCLTNPARIYFDFRHARAAHGLQVRTALGRQRKVRRFRLGRHAPDTVRAVLEVEGVAGYRAYRTRTPPRLIIKLTEGRRHDSPCPQGAQESAVDEAPVIVIDPGHGGRDKGARGVSGSSEAQVALAVAKRLAALLRDQGEADVLLTRKDNRFLSLAQRTEIATSADAAVFVSLHAEAGRAAAQCGPRTYYLALTTSRTALRLASRENATYDHTVHELPALLDAIMRDQHTKESRQLAGIMERALSPQRNTGRKKARSPAGRRAPLTVLMGLDSPGVVVSLGCMKRPAEARRLRSKKYQRKLARALYAGIHDFLREESQTETAQTARQTNEQAQDP